MSEGRRGAVRGRYRAVAAAAGCLVIAAMVALPAGTAHAFTGCSLDSGTHVETVQSTSGSMTIIRSGDDLVFAGTHCGTVNTVDTVNLDMSGTSSADIDLELSGGPFALGATLEGNASSEIEFSISNIGSGTRVVVIGTNGPDSISLGDRHIFPTMELVTGINLNGSSTGTPRTRTSSSTGRRPCWARPARGATTS